MATIFKCIFCMKIFEFRIHASLGLNELAEAESPHDTNFVVTVGTMTTAGAAGDIKFGILVTLGS